MAPGTLEAIGAKPALRVRSGSCGGLDLVTEDGTWINAPVNEPWAQRSRLELRAMDGRLLVADGTACFPVTAVPAPAYYGDRSPSGAPLHRIAQLCSDRVGVGLTNICAFYRSMKDRCGFCSIGGNVGQEQARKDLADVVAAVVAAVEDPIAPARHVLLGGGTFDREDGSAPEIAEAATAIKSVCDVPIYAMITPPRDLGLLRALADAGVDELGMNIEVFGEHAARRHIPGKQRSIGHERYWAALEAAVEIFGPVNTRSITVVGLEPPDTTVRGVERLAALGVLPILSPLRPLAGTALESQPRSTAAQLADLQERCAEAAAAYDVPLGPTCIACQSNTLTVPGHSAYRLY